MKRGRSASNELVRFGTTNVNRQQRQLVCVVACPQKKNEGQTPNTRCAKNRPILAAWKQVKCTVRAPKSYGGASPLIAAPPTTVRA